jgi:mono/diheme cytochrome c family protein
MCRSDLDTCVCASCRDCIRSLAALVAAVCCFSAGCVQEMADQPRYKPLAASSAFPNGAASRPPVPGTVARGQLQLDNVFFVGKSNGQLVTELPARALEGTSMSKLLHRGQDRFDVFCSHCHGQVGGGTGGSDEMRTEVGMVVLRGFPMPPTFHQPRLREAPIGHLFDVMTNGLGRMPAHGYLMPAEDRWAIALYIRALQFSQNAPRDRLSTADLDALNTQATKSTPSQPE